MKTLSRRKLICGVLLSSCLLLAGETLESVVAKTLRKTVPLVTTTELAKELDSGKSLILLDSREHAEFAVSHLPKAHWIGYEKFELTTLAKLPKTQPIVIYCSIGYRSEKIGEKLQAAGFRNVRNLSGGLFAWANENRPLTTHQSQPTKAVHGYDKEWAKLLLPHVQRKLPPKKD